MRRSRAFRSQKLERFGRFCLQKGITANMVTFAALLAGLGAIYFLFTNVLFFILLAILHLVLDTFDGVIARCRKPSKFGAYFDYLSDSLVALGLTLKIALYITPLAFLAAFFSLLTLGVYVSSKLKSPIVFVRTFVLISLMLNQPIIAFLIMGAASLFSLLKQVQWFFGRE